MAAFQKTKMPYNPLTSASNVSLSSNSSKNYRYGTHIFSYKPDRRKLSYGSDESILSAIYNRIAIDVASMEFKHAQLDSDGRFINELSTCLNDCLTLSSNIDQTARAFFLDAALSLIDEGVIAIVPMKTTENPMFTDSYDIGELRVGKIVQWEPDRVKINIYNDKTGIHGDMMQLKRCVAIVENPFYSTMNEPNSVAVRLKEKLALLDKTDKLTSSGKLDVIIQLPYQTKSEHQRSQAQRRKRDIEMQLVNSKYGIAYIDGTEKITQLNRPVENNLQAQIEYLTKQLYNRLGITEEILNGTASDTAMLNYYNRIIEPICSAICDEMNRKFLSKTAISQRKAVVFFRDPFRLVPVSQLADIADKFTRNEIMSSNEVRSIIGYKPSDQPGADELRNKNINQNSSQMQGGYGEDSPEDVESSSSGLNVIERQMNDFLKEIGE